MKKNQPKCGSLRQRGAETVEFMLTLLLFLLVFFMIVDFAIALYNRGTVINASREGARQASLFWIDPLLFDPLTPESNQLLKRSMVESVMTWTETNLLIDPQAVGQTMTLQLIRDDEVVPIVGPTRSVSSTDQVCVDVSHPHSFLGITPMTGIEGPNLRSAETLGVE